MTDRWKVGPSAVALESLRSQAELSFEKGDHLAAFEYLSEAIKWGDHSSTTVYRAVLSLARSGATSHAASFLEQHRNLLEDTEDSRALKARILKDQFRAAKEISDKKALGLLARDAYLAIFMETGGYFPAINAATLSYLIEDTNKAEQLALEALKQCDLHGKSNYWVEATRAEAFLLLGNLEEVKKSLSRADKCAPGEVSKRSTTYTQLKLICEKSGVRLAVIEGIRPPAVCHFVGHLTHGLGRSPGIAPEDEAELKERTRQILEEERIGYGFGALACGADLIVAEEILAIGGEIHVILPTSVESFMKRSVEPAGKEVVRRFRACMSRVSSLEIVGDDQVDSGDLPYATASLQAMGMARLKAEALGAECVQIAIWNGIAGNGSAGTALSIDRWSKMDGRLIHIESRVPQNEGSLSVVGLEVSEDLRKLSEKRVLHAAVFADVNDFSKLDERTLATFLELWQSSLATICKKYRKELLFVNTWGDAVFFVLDGVVPAAAVCLELTKIFNSQFLSRSELPSSLGVRVSSHAGIMFVTEDPVLGKNNFFGMNVNKAARMEPCTPVNSVFVTEAFAALLAMETQHDFRCEYAGNHALPKGFGEFRMYYLDQRR